MNILHVIDGLRARDGGDVRACVALADHTARLGHAVMIWTLATSEAELEPRDAGTVRVDPPVRTRYGFAHHAIPPLWSAIAWADIVHVHRIWRFTTLAALMIALLRRKPCIVQPHGSLDPVKLDHKWRRKRLYFTLVERHVLRHASAVWVESERDDRQVKAMVPSARTVLVPSGADPGDFRLGDPASAFAELWPQMAGLTCFLFLARLDVNKGLPILLEAFEGLAERANSTIGLLIIGADFNQTWSGVSARFGGRIRNVHYAGVVSDTEKIAALGGCAAYVLPSLGENFGITVVEAMLAGKPVVTTTATPWREIEDHAAGFLVQPRADAVKDALQRILDMTEEERAACGRRGRALAMRRYTWPAIARVAVEEYRRLLG